MIRSGKLIEEIIENLNFFRGEIKSNAKLGLLNQNKHAENLAKKILNIVFDLELSSLNEHSSNFPGLDLGDKNKSGIAFQVTSQSNSKKINETLNVCLKEQHYKSFKKIKILILSNKQKNYKLKAKTEPWFPFSITEDILDFDDLFQKINHLSIEKLQTISDLVKSELPTIFVKPEESTELFEELPELILSLSNTFQIELTDEEIEIYLMEIFHLLDLKSSNFHKIKIKQETFFQERLKELNNYNKTISEKREIIEVKLILNEILKLKNEISMKVKILYHTDKFPISKSYSHIVICLKEIVEKLSFPQILIEETNYLRYFQINKPIEAKKFQGNTKFEIFKSNNDGVTLGCSVWLSKQEIVEIASKQNYFTKALDHESLISKLQLFGFDAMNFNIDTLTTKVIPSFVDRFYSFKSGSYKYINENDYSSWTDLTNYKVGLG